MKLLLDQGLPHSAAILLRDAGWEVEHVSERNMSKATDIEILAVARNEGRTIVTLDADFHAWLAVTLASAPSVVRLRIEGLDGSALAGMLQASWPKIHEALDGGAMVTITDRGIRVKRLPI